MTTLCAAPRHGEDEVETETHSYLCKPCRLGLLSGLRRLPRLHAELDHVPARGDGDGSGLPFSEPASECRSQISHDLRYWFHEIVDIRGMDAPPTARYGRTPNAVHFMAGWLAGQVTWCTFRDWAPHMAGAISADRSRALALLDPWVTKRFEIPGHLGVCLACNAAQVSVTVYASDGDRRRSFIGCPGCGMVWEPEQWLSYGRRVVQRREALAS